MQPTSFHAKAQEEFRPAPSLLSTNQTKVGAAKSIPLAAPCVGVAVTSDGDVPKEVGIDRSALSGMGFEGNLGQTQMLRPGKGPTFVAFGVGPHAEVDAAKLRDGAAAFARAAESYEQ